MFYSWQPATVLYPDAELVMCDATRAVFAGMGRGDVFVGREVPQNIGTGSYHAAVVWNRTGGLEPDAFMQCRVFAPTDFEAMSLARELSARIQACVTGRPIARIVESSGITDLGVEAGPMRQVLYAVTLRGTQLELEQPDTIALGGQS
jgi:hypothetical protein